MIWYDQIIFRQVLKIWSYFQTVFHINVYNLSTYFIIHIIIIFSSNHISIILSYFSKYQILFLVGLIISPHHILIVYLSSNYPIFSWSSTSPPTTARLTRSLMCGSSNQVTHLSFIQSTRYQLYLWYLSYNQPGSNFIYYIFHIINQVTTLLLFHMINQV